MRQSGSPTVLAVTVGGSCQPVVTAVADYRPHHVVFIASDGPRGSIATVAGAGKPCQGRAAEDAKPSIVAQTGLDESQHTIHTIADPDSLQACYSVTRSALTEATHRFPNCRYVADYTGGTKTMSVALAMTALEFGWELSLVKGARTDLVKVIDGTEVASLVNSTEVRARQQLEEARRLFNDYHYAAAESVAGAILRTGPLSGELQTTLRMWVGLARGFDAWDRFDHSRALQILTPYQAQLVESFILLKQITRQNRRATGYEKVLDLVRNAERRAHQGRYDDAVARLYRACEMFAQVRLEQRQPSLNAGNLDVGALPENLVPIYDALRDPSDGMIKLGLRQDYELLADLDDPVGAAYQVHRKKLLNGLNARNSSILAHGATPIDANSYSDFYIVVDGLFADALERLGIDIKAPQLPRFEQDDLLRN